MKSNFKKLPGSKIELEVLLSKDEFRPYWDAAHEHALTNVHLKGFRPGTAPKELAEKAIDNDKVFEEAAHNAVRFSLDEAVKDNEWTPIDTPKIEILETPDTGFKYKAELTIFPEVKLGNYKRIAKRAVAESEDRRKKIKVEPAELEKSLDWLRKSRAREGSLPELNDEFAKSLGPDFKTLEDVKNSIKEGLTFEKERKEQERLKAKIIDDVVKDSQIDIPEIMVEKTLNSMVKDYQPMMQAAGKKEEELRAQLRDRAKNNVAANLVLYKIARAENLEPTKEEIENEAKEKNLDVAKFYDYIYGIVLNGKIFQHLTAKT